MSSADDVAGMRHMPTTELARGRDLDGSSSEHGQRHALVSQSDVLLEPGALAELHDALGAEARES